MRNVEFAVRIGGKAMPSRLVVRARAFHGRVVLRDVEINRPRPQCRREFRERLVEGSFVFPIIPRRQDGVLLRVVAERVKKRVRHVRLETDGPRAVHEFEQPHHFAPTVHAAPTNLAFGGETLAKIFGHGRRFAEGPGDKL